MSQSRFVKRIVTASLRFLFFFAVPIAIALCIVMATIGYVYFSYHTDEVDILSDYNQFDEPLRIYDKNGVLLATYGTQERIIVSYDQIPPALISACLAAEDSRFFSHNGVDFKSLLRAVIDYATKSGIKTGASTITMQVSRNFFLTPEKTIIRKIREIFLALKIERELPKEQILELYVNKIFLGFRSYGFAAAAKTYYKKPLSELSLAQYAMLAALPKAPSKINPLVNTRRALQRRNWILGRMLSLGYIDLPAYNTAVQEPISAQLESDTIDLNIGYVSEWVRLLLLNNKRFLPNQLSPAALYRSGYKVYTTIDASLQKEAQVAVVKGLVNRENIIGYRGAEGHLDTITSYQAEEQMRTIIADALDQENRAAQRHNLLPAVVVAENPDSVAVMSADSKVITLTQEDIPYELFIEPNQAGVYDYSDETVSAIGKIESLLQVGDVVRIRLIDGRWQLTQLPDLQAALISLHPETGRIETLIGGFDASRSLFNRATQSKRQIGSIIKPFVYMHALETGMTAATEISDAPFVEEQGNNEIWRPFNAGGNFLGPIRLRKALYLSRNLVSVRLLHSLGVKATIKRLTELGFDAEQLSPDLSLALGSGVASPLKVVRLYALLANGGYPVLPVLIEQVQDKDGEILYQANIQPQCRDCAETNKKDSLIDPAVDFIINDMLHDVVQRGTARAAQKLDRSDVYGKTGTTNQQTDAWFAGYSRDIVTVVWVGHDNSYSIGGGASGSSVALPIWIDYMQKSLARYRITSLNMPETVVEVPIDEKEFVLVDPKAPDAVLELFVVGSEPTQGKQEQFVPRVLDTKQIDTPEDIFN